MEWYTRSNTWKRATDAQIKAVTNYLETHQEEQIIDEIVLFKDVKRKNDTIYTVYMCGDKVFELLYDTPLHVAYINRLTDLV